MPAGKEVAKERMDKELEKFKALQEKLQRNYDSRMGMVAQQQAFAAFEQRILHLEARVEERLQRTAEECQASLSKSEASIERRVQVRLRDSDREQKQFDRRLTELAGHCQEITESLHGHVRRSLETFNKHSQKLSELKASGLEDLPPRPDELQQSDAGLRLEINQVSEKLQRYYEDSMCVHTRLHSLEEILRSLRSQVDVHMEMQREALLSTEQPCDSAVFEERFSKLIDQFSSLHGWAEAFGTRLASVEAALLERSASEERQREVITAGRKEFNEASQAESRGGAWTSTLKAGHLLAAAGANRKEEKAEAPPLIVTCLTSYAKNMPTAEVQRLDEANEKDTRAASDDERPIRMPTLTCLTSYKMEASQAPPEDEASENAAKAADGEETEKGSTNLVAEARAA